MDEDGKYNIWHLDARGHTIHGTEHSNAYDTKMRFSYTHVGGD